jgi:hypothetical protein
VGVQVTDPSARLLSLVELRERLSTPSATSKLPPPPSPLVSVQRRLLVHTPGGASTATPTQGEFSAPG